MKQENAVAPAPDAERPKASATPQVHPVGTILDGYRLVRLIGTGGFGAVYEAVHVFTERRVAFKLMLPQHANGRDERERARKEAIALCRLRHKNVVSVHSAGMLPDGAVWIAMELLEGQLLRRICEVESPLPPEKALYFAIEIADGLAAAHDLGIIHRDVKPENVFVDVQHQVKLLDLNIAKVPVHGMRSTDREGLRFGTTAYLPPEACWGAPWTFAGDVYSLSVVIYEMLAGRHPFANGRGLDGLPSAGELVAAHLLQFPGPVHEANPAVPAYFWPVVTRGLAKQPAERFKDAAALASALRELRERYVTDLRTGAPAERGAPAAVALTAPGARREHRGPRAPARLATVPMRDEPRVIVRDAAEETTRAAEAIVKTEVLAAGTASPTATAPLPAGAGSPVLSTPGPVMVPSARVPVRRAPSPRLSTTARVPDHRRRAQLLRRRVMVALVAVPLIGALSALSVHLAADQHAASTGAAATRVPTTGSLPNPVPAAAPDPVAAAAPDPDPVAAAAPDPAAAAAPDPAAAAAPDPAAAPVGGAGLPRVESAAAAAVFTAPAHVPRAPTVPATTAGGARSVSPAGQGKARSRAPAPEVDDDFYAMPASAAPRPAPPIAAPQPPKPRGGAPPRPF